MFSFTMARFIVAGRTDLSALCAYVSVERTSSESWSRQAAMLMPHTRWPERFSIATTTLLSSFRAGVRAGATLLAIGAHSLGDLGEIGPIDVQRAKQDDLWESSSGLTEDAAIAALENAAWMMFQRFVVEIKGISAGRITFKTAADVASNLVSGAFSPIFAQIDPLKIGENSRAMKIASPTYSWWAEFIG